MFQKKFGSIHILLIVQIIIILALLPGCFRQEQLVYTVTGEDIHGTGTQEGNIYETSVELPTLVSGVYQVRVQANLSDNQSMTVEMRSGGQYYKSLYTNAGILFSGDEYMDFEAYIAGKMTDAYMHCEINNNDTSALIQLDVYKTSLGGRILLLTIALCFGMVDFLLLLRKAILEGHMTGKQQLVFWSLTAGILLSFFPYLTDYYSFGYDTMFHLSRIAYLKDSLLDGAVFPVRMQGSWLYGHGYAVSLFYGDLLLYIPALLMIMGFSLMAAFKTFVFIVMVATAIVAYFCIKKCVKDEYAALFGAMLYLLAPYRLLNIFGRGALGEFIAMIFLPLVCCGMYLLYTGDVESKEYKGYKWYLIAGMSGLLQCHIISVEMAAAFMALTCVILWKKTFRKVTFLQLLQSVGNVLLLNAWFLIPFLHMMGSDSYNLSNLEAGELETKGLYVSEVFQLLPEADSLPHGQVGHEPAQIGVGILVLLIGYFIWHRRTRKGSNSCTFFALYTMLGLFLSTNLLPWDALTSLPGIGFIICSVQFPWRFMSLASVCAAMFAAFFFVRVKEYGGKWIRTTLGIAGGLAIILVVYQTNAIAITEDPVYLYEEENMGTTGVVSAEYLLLGNMVGDYYYHDPVAEEGLNWFHYEKKGTNVTIRLHNETAEIRYIELPLIGYKGYGIKAEEAAELPYIAEERGNHDDLRIAVPAGYNGTVRVSYHGFPIFRVAEVISCISVLAIAGYFWWKEKRYKIFFWNRES